MVEINEAEKKKEKRIKRNEDNIRDLWDNVQQHNTTLVRLNHCTILQLFQKNNENN